MRLRDMRMPSRASGRPRAVYHARSFRVERGFGLGTGMAAVVALPFAAAVLLMLYLAVRLSLLAGINDTSAGGRYSDPLAPEALAGTEAGPPAAAPSAEGASGETRDWTPFTWEGWSYRALLSRLEAAAASKRVELRVIGRARYGAEAYPVVAVMISAATPKVVRARVLLTGGVHGNERAGAESVVRFVELLARSPSTFSDVAFDAIAVVNPWGWVYDSRQNGAGKDINRDFSSSRTQEAAIVREFVKAQIRQNGAYQVALDHHESAKDGYFVYQYTSRLAGLGGAYAHMVEEAGKPLERQYREAGFPVRRGVLSIPAIALPYVSLLGRLSLEQWLRLSGTRHSYTLESPLSDALADRVQLHVDATSVIVSEYLRRAGLVTQGGIKKATARRG